METIERIVESYMRYARRWATISGIKCDDNFEIELVAIDPRSGTKYHIESAMSGPDGFAPLTAVPADPSDPSWRAERTMSYFIERRFGGTAVRAELEKFGFAEGNYRKVLVAYQWSAEAKSAADAAGVDLWDFRPIVHEIADIIEHKGRYFTDAESRGRIHFLRAHANGTNNAVEPAMVPGVEIASRDYWFKFDGSATWVLMDPHPSGIIARFLGDTGTVFDEMSFASVREAEAALERNDFRPYAADVGAETYLTPPRPPFRALPQLNRIYSSGRDWK